MALTKASSSVEGFIAGAIGLITGHILAQVYSSHYNPGVFGLFDHTVGYSEGLAMVILWGPITLFTILFLIQLGLAKEILSKKLKVLYIALFLLFAFGGMVVSIQVFYTIKLKYFTPQPCPAGLRCVDAY